MYQKIGKALLNAFIAVVCWVVLETVFFLPLVLTSIYEMFAFDGIASILLCVLMNGVPLLCVYFGLYALGKRLFPVENLRCAFVAQILTFLLVGIFRVITSSNSTAVVPSFFGTPLPPLETLLVVSVAGSSEHLLSKAMIGLLSVLLSLLPAVFVCIGIKRSKGLLY